MRCVAVCGFAVAGGGRLVNRVGLRGVWKNRTNITIDWLHVWLAYVCVYGIALCVCLRSGLNDDDDHDDDDGFECLSVFVCVCLSDTIFAVHVAYAVSHHADVYYINLYSPHKRHAV